MTLQSENWAKARRRAAPPDPSGYFDLAEIELLGRK